MPEGPFGIISNHPVKFVEMILSAQNILICGYLGYNINSWQLRRNEFLLCKNKSQVNI